MSKVNVSLKIEENIKDKIDNIATLYNRDRSFIINQAINNYVELQEWQMKKIEKAITQANNGEVVTEAEANKVFKRIYNNS